MATGSNKRLAITKANAQIVAVVGISAFITVFSLVASQALWKQNSYLSKVSGIKKKANVQLQKNLKASDSLVASYHTFTTTQTNAIGGLTKGTNSNDGDNAKIVLDALPSSYDFPALASSIEKILGDRNLKVGSISGTDDEVAQQAASVGSAAPVAVPMSFSFSVDSASYQSVQDLVSGLQLSIRPIVVDTISLTGAANNMTFGVTAHTYFQQPKTVSITSSVVK
jgi:hypothetical protein